MKIICDVHISYKLVNFLKLKGIEAIHVNEILDKWFTKDKAICRFADENDYVVLTKDIDFRNTFFLQDTPKKLIRISLGNIKNQELINIFDKYLDKIIKSLECKSCYLEIEKDNILVIFKD